MLPRGPLVTTPGDVGGLLIGSRDVGVRGALGGV